MRELHVAGYNANENKIILRDSTNDDEFSIVADEQLRAAARGDVPGMCQVTVEKSNTCLLYTSPSPRDRQKSRMPSSA